MAKQVVSEVAGRGVQAFIEGLQNKNSSVEKLYELSFRELYGLWKQFVKDLPPEEKHYVRIHGGFVRSLLRDEEVKDIDFLIENEEVGKKFYLFLQEKGVLSKNRTFESLLPSSKMKDGYIRCFKWLKGFVDVTYVADSECMDADVNNLQIWFDSSNKMFLSTEFETEQGITSELLQGNTFRLNANYHAVTSTMTTNQEVLQGRKNKLLDRKYIHLGYTDFGKKFDAYGQPEEKQTFHPTSAKESDMNANTTMNGLVQGFKAGLYNRGAAYSAEFVRDGIVQILRALMRDDLGEKTDEVMSAITLALETQLGKAAVKLAMWALSKNLPWNALQGNAHFQGFSNSLCSNAFEDVIDVTRAKGLILAKTLAPMIRKLASAPIPGLSSVKDTLRVVADKVEATTEEELEETIMKAMQSTAIAA